MRKLMASAAAKSINDPNCSHHALLSMAVTTILEEILVLHGRFMIGAIEDPRVTFLTIFATGLEEAFIRCTIIQRDELWSWLYVPPTPATRVAPRLRFSPCCKRIRNSPRQCSHASPLRTYRFSSYARDSVGEPNHTENELRFIRLQQAASTASSMRMEFQAILVSRLVYALMRNHR